MSRLTRRALLGRGVGAGSLALAGCSRLEVGPLSGDTGTFLDWLPAPEALGVDHYRPVRLDAATYRSLQDAVHPAVVDLLDRQYFGAFERLHELLGRADEHVLAGGAAARVHGGVDTAGADDALGDAGYDHREEYRGFDLYVHRTAEAADASAEFLGAMGVGDDVVVVATWAVLEPEPPERVRAVVDAKRGATTRYHEASTPFEAAATVAGERTITRIYPDSGPEGPGGLEAQAHAWDLGPETTELRLVMQFEDEHDARVADVEEWADENGLADYESVGVSREGPTVTADGTAPTERFDLGLPGDPGADGIPHVEFAFETGDREVTVVHDGGQAVGADALRIEVDGDAAAVQFADEHQVVEEGDAVTVPTGFSATVWVFWDAPGRERGVLLDSVRVGGDG